MQILSPLPPPGYGLPAPTIGHHSKHHPPKTKMRKGFRLQVKRGQTNIFLRFIHSSLPSTHSGVNNPSGRDTKIEKGERSRPRSPSLPPVGPAPSEGAVHPARVQACPVLEVGGRGPWESEAAGHAGMCMAHIWQHTLLRVVSGSCQGRKSSMTTRVSLIICCR